MQNFPNNIVPTSLYCNKYYTRCASACQCPSDGRSLTGQSTVPSTRVWRITSATRKTLWRLRAAATPSSATMGPREPSDGRSLTGQSTVPSTRVWRITSATRKTLWRLRAAATPSSATMGPRERSSGHHFCGGAAETDGTVHRASLAHRISRQPLLARKRSGRQALRFS